MMKTVMSLVAVLFMLAGCGGMGLAFSEETSAANTAIVLAVVGAGLAISGLLLYSIITNEDLKEAIDSQNEILIGIGRSIEESRKTNVEIARRQFQAEKRQTGSLRQE